MKEMKVNPQSKSSGQVLVIVIIVLALIGAGFWWLFSNKEAMAKEGRAFGREAVQRIAVQHDLNFFASHLSPEARLQFPPSAQQDFIGRIQKLGTPAGSVDVQGDITFQSQFFEPRGNFHARINYPARGAEINVAISHPVGRWQIDDVAFAPDQER
ncbi:MAG: hypothetical protein DME99_05870 [Verrucomicrobia bacterium]|nr:MAG: hypothetical protein DME99_05870 [Verrucomicrobiota bacterium]